MTKSEMIKPIPHWHSHRELTFITARHCDKVDCSEKVSLLSSNARRTFSSKWRSTRFFILLFCSLLASSQSQDGLLAISERFLSCQHRIKGATLDIVSSQDVSSFIAESKNLAVSQGERHRDSANLIILRVLLSSSRSRLATRTRTRRIRPHQQTTSTSRAHTQARWGIRFSPPLSWFLSSDSNDDRHLRRTLTAS